MPNISKLSSAWNLKKKKKNGSSSMKLSLPRMLKDIGCWDTSQVQTLI